MKDKDQSDGEEAVDSIFYSHSHFQSYLMIFIAYSDHSTVYKNKKMNLTRQKTEQ